MEEQDRIDEMADALDNALGGLKTKTYAVNGLSPDCTVKYKDTLKSHHYMLATVTAPETNSEGQKFSYWADEHGRVVSTYLSYSFYSVKERTLYPVYGVKVPAEARVSSYVADVRDNLDGTYSVLIEHSASSTVKVAGHGVVFTYNADKKDALNVGSEDSEIFDIVAQTTATSRTGIIEIKISAPADAEKIYVRPYVILKNSSEPVYGYEAADGFDVRANTGRIAPDGSVSVNEADVKNSSSEPLGKETVKKDDAGKPSTSQKSDEPGRRLTLSEKFFNFIRSIFSKVLSPIKVK